MRKGKVAARVLTAAIALAMLTQNVSTVYAEEAHQHTESCYEQGELTCTQEEHSHDDSCETRTLTCTVEEHTHSEEACGLNEDGSYACGLEEHTHSDACYEITTCDKAEHTHDADCYEQKLICTQEETKKESQQNESEETVSENVKAFLDAVNAFQYDETAELTEEEQDALDAEIDHIDSLYKALSEDEQQCEDVVKAYKAFQALFHVDEIMLLDETNEGAPVVEDGKAVLNGTTYETLSAAMDAAQSGDTIYLGKGKYYGTDDQGQKGTGAGKSLTFVGTSQSDTVFEIQNAKSYGSDQHANYAFDGSDAITFKNMKLQMPSNQYDSGFVRVNHMRLEDCVFDGNGAYWGYQDTTFKNVTFYPQDEVKQYIIFTINKNDYAVYTKTGSTYTFDGCTFYSKGGKAVKVYKDGASGNDTIYFKGCTVVNASGVSDKQILCIDDSYHNATIYVSGDSSISGKEVQYDNMSCSRLYGFGRSSSCNNGNTTVYIEGEKVFENGELVDHEHGAISKGSYQNGKASNSDYDYSEGHKDDAYTYDTKMVVDQTTGVAKFVTTKTCKYCGWSDDEDVDMETLGGDMLIDGNTEHDEVVEVSRGQKFAMTGTLEVSAVKSEIAAVEKSYTHNNPQLGDINCTFTAIMTVPTGISLPSNPQVTVDGMNDVFEVKSTKVEGKTITVTLGMTDQKIGQIYYFADLKDAVNSVNDKLSVTVADVSVDNNAPVNQNLTMTGEVSGHFTAFAWNEQVAAIEKVGMVASTTVNPGMWGGHSGLNFSFDWEGKQTPAGRDAAYPNSDAISLTVIIPLTPTPTPTPTPSPDPTPSNDGGSSSTTPQTIQTITEIGAVEETPQEIVEIGNVEEAPQEITEYGAIATTGDNSLIATYAAIAAIAAAVLVIWYANKRKNHI